MLPMLRLIDLAVARGARTLYRNVSLIAPPGERIGLIGANGSGKSTLFAAILGELRSTAERSRHLRPSVSPMWRRTSKPPTRPLLPTCLADTRR